MTWEKFYLICFALGFAFSLISFIGGALNLHWPTKFHFNVGRHGGHIPHAHGGHIGHAHSANSSAQAGVIDLAYLSPFNMPSMMAFLAWFGGVGFLMTHHYRTGFFVSLAVSIIGGLIGGAIVFLFLGKLMSFEGSLDPAEYEMVGVIGSVSNAIREGGVGEIKFIQGGTRRACGARSEDGKSMPKGSEIVVTAYEKGIAYVRHWEEFANSESSVKK